MQLSKEEGADEEGGKRIEPSPRCDAGSWTEAGGYLGAMELTWKMRLHGLGHGVHPAAEGHAEIDLCAIVVAGGPEDGVERE